MDKQRDKAGLGQSFLNPIPHSPDAAPTTDTSPQSLGLHSSIDDLEKATDLSASSRVRRVVEKTVDKLGRSKSVGTKNQPTSPRRKMFSLHRARGSRDMTSGSVIRFIYICTSVKLNYHSLQISPEYAIRHRRRQLVAPKTILHFSDLHPPPPQLNHL
jgi:hypothetical protein